MTAGSRSGARSPFDGDRRLISATTASFPVGRRNAAAKSRGGGASRAARRMASRVAGWCSSVTSSRFAARISASTPVIIGECTADDLDSRSMIQFPDGFVWGTATAAHQVEGGNWNNDWWMWEHEPTSPCVEPSGDACDHFWRYPDDIALLAELGFGAYRFSLEWSRIEPEDGEFSVNALDHYRRMVDCCRENGLLPVVTYHHFTSPRWTVTELGGWEDPAVAERFGRFCERTAAHLGADVGMSCTLNEPNVVALMGYYLGVFPPGKRDEDLLVRSTDNLIRAHRLAYDAIK